MQKVVYLSSFGVFCYLAYVLVCYVARFLRAITPNECPSASEAEGAALDASDPSSVDPQYHEVPDPDRQSLRKRDGDRESSAISIVSEHAPRKEQRNDIYGIYGSEFARRTFLERNDEFSENELMAACGTLNYHINTLSRDLIKAKSRTHERINVTVTDSEGAQNTEFEGNTVAAFVRNVMGDRLSEELASAKGGTGGPKATNRIIRNGLDVWSISCVYLAMKPMLFGLRIRMNEEINEIIEHMEDHDKEMAGCWNRFRAENAYKPTENDETMAKFVSDIWPLQRNGRRDAEIRESENLERVYRAIKSDGDNEPQVCLHWRALAHKHELGLESYKAAIAQTKEIIQRGLLHVFVMAGEEPPSLSDNPRLLEKIDKTVEEAAILAKSIKTTIFSQNIEVFVADQEKPYDEQSMIHADKVDEGSVKCTTKLGLQGTDGTGKRKILIKAEVLLTKLPDRNGEV